MNWTLHLLLKAALERYGMEGTTAKKRRTQCRMYMGGESLPKTVICFCRFIPTLSVLRQTALWGRNESIYDC